VRELTSHSTPDTPFKRWDYPCNRLYWDWKPNNNEIIHKKAKN